MPARPVTAVKPIAEQEAARELFLRGEGLCIDVYAGTGKTTTLQLLANSSGQRGLYLAFNRSIAEDARSRFPDQVACATSHSIAFRGVRVRLGYPEWKFTGTLTWRADHIIHDAGNGHLSIRVVSAETILLFDSARCSKALSAKRRS